MVEENSLERVARILRNAIEEIDRLARRQSLVASTPNVNNSSHALTQPSSVSAPRTGEPQRDEYELTELRRRLPTLNSSSFSRSGSGWGRFIVQLGAGPKFCSKRPDNCRLSS